MAPHGPVALITLAVIMVGLVGRNGNNLDTDLVRDIHQQVGNGNARQFRHGTQSRQRNMTIRDPRTNSLRGYSKAVSQVCLTPRLLDCPIYCAHFLTPLFKNSHNYTTANK
jgi:hypothetical protein